MTETMKRVRDAAEAAKAPDAECGMRLVFVRETEAVHRGESRVAGSVLKMLERLEARAMEGEK